MLFDAICIILIHLQTYLFTTLNFISNYYSFCHFFSSPTHRNAKFTKIEFTGWSKLGSTILRFKNTKKQRHSETRLHQHYLFLYLSGSQKIEERKALLTTKVLTRILGQIGKFVYSSFSVLIYAVSSLFSLFSFFYSPINTYSFFPFPPEHLFLFLIIFSFPVLIFPSSPPYLPLFLFSLFFFSLYLSSFTLLLSSLFHFSTTYFFSSLLSANKRCHASLSISVPLPSVHFPSLLIISDPVPIFKSNPLLSYAMPFSFYFLFSFFLSPLSLFSFLLFFFSLFLSYFTLLFSIFLFSSLRLQEMSRTLDRRAEAIKSYFQNDLRKVLLSLLCLILFLLRYY